MNVLTADELERLLGLAHQVVTWTGQDTIRPDAAGAKYLRAARQAYLKARIETTAARGIQLCPGDTGGCTCNPHKPAPAECMYHYAAQLQPDNHRMPWNCPTYYDGCNCKEKPA